MAGKVTSVRLAEDVHSKLAALAHTQDRSVGYLINLAVERMLEDHEVVMAKVTEGLRQLDAGLGIDHADVAAIARQIAADAGER